VSRSGLTRVLGFSGVRNSSRRREGDVIRWDNLEALRFLRWSKQQNRGKLHWREGQPGAAGGQGTEEAEGRRREEVQSGERILGVGWRVSGTRREETRGHKSLGRKRRFSLLSRAVAGSFWCGPPHVLSIMAVFSSQLGGAQVRRKTPVQYCSVR
jgi:hypothetical protein